MTAQTVQGKLWEISVKACVIAMPFFIGFSVWLTSQIYTLKVQAALAEQQRETIVRSTEKDRSVLEKINQQQVAILLTLERITVRLEEIFEKK